MSEPVAIIDPPDGAVLMHIASPGFRAVEPDIINSELTPASVYAAVAAQREPVFAPRTVTAWLLQDVFVACEGLVFDHHGALYGPSITQHAPAEIEWAAGQVREAIAGATVPGHDGPLVLGKKRGAANYGHWLMEMLPMLHLVLSRVQGDRLGVLVHDIHDPQLGEVMQSSMRLAGIADEQVRVSNRFPVRVRRLILVDGLTRHGTYMSPLVRACHDRLAHDSRGTGHERVFIARGIGMRRDFARAAELEALAERKGFQVLRTAGTTLQQQIGAVRDARVIVGAMGAAMTSIAFARPAAQVLVFAGAAMPDTFFWFVANQFGHRYREVRCRQTEVEAGASYDRDLLITDAEFGRHLAAA
ncbi:glycosyltransferase family 61 protein [Lichenicola cladoniae]|uniref:Glycosyltransferase family 61 protein n=1 Tax=Lichenicola cladoniae TaxID=1484109 RepID=A0A6M8HN75_9PROT|nr:glycosyltransferase 61 family protein [Lichenicola cladoniae]NPD67225.1 glycosyltransferase family 61 protein [Acetobacteraceae bacterium]QKE89737.1 glycosyltransferase family 61 protein [Lichenicola cladoniae]